MNNKPLNNESHLSAWLRISFLPGIGGVRFSKLLAKDAPTNIVNYSQEQLLAFGFNHKQLNAWRGLDREIDACLEWRSQQPNREIITLDDPRYPPLLKQAPAAPPILFIQGNIKALSEPQIAMVGSRHASIDGLRHAKRFAAELTESGLIVTSGLALGIDGYAHDGALNRGGETIAVLGSGLNNVYPTRHRDLAARIEQQGALVSELRPSAKPRAEHFPRRNRIISGLSLGVLVVEAAERSGSLITARYALEQGREVFALPTSIDAPNARGGNQLLKQGASLVQSAQDIFDEIQSLLNWSSSYNQDLLCDSDQQPSPYPELLANIGKEPTPVDILSARTNITVQDTMNQLLELELLGYVTAISGGYVRNGES